MELDKFEEQVFFCAIKIESRDGAGNLSIGTGFLLRHPLTDGKHAILAVSNKHVLVDRTRSIRIVFSAADLQADPVKPKLGRTVTLEGKALEDLYYCEHPDPAVDLACLNVSIVGGPGVGVFYRTFELSMAAKFDEPWLVPNRDVCFIGFPDGRFDTANNLPILRRGVIASIPKVDFDGQKQFVIDAQVFPGSSGSPVFCASSLLGGKMHFMGVLTAVMIKNQKLVPLPTSQASGIQQVLGLGLVLKPSLVAELVEHTSSALMADLKAEGLEPLVGAEAAKGTPST
jgi:hypothetical protein